MRNIIQEALKQCSNAHVEIRVEEKTTTIVRFKNKERPLLYNTTNIEKDLEDFIVGKIFIPREHEFETQLTSGNVDRAAPTFSIFPRST